jgi:uncharacterized protein (TIGR02301 family)
MNRATDWVMSFLPRLCLLAFLGFFAAGSLIVAAPRELHAQGFFDLFDFGAPPRRRAPPPRPPRPVEVPPMDPRERGFRQPRPAPDDDLPPVEAREPTAPPPPDDRPYDDKLLRLAEILGAVHYLRELCGAAEGQIWRDQMRDLVKLEGSTAVRRAKLVRSFNNGYRGYRRTYRTCTPSATVAINRFTVEGADIAFALASAPN